MRSGYKIEEAVTRLRLFTLARRNDQVTDDAPKVERAKSLVVSNERHIGAALEQMKGRLHIDDPAYPLGGGAALLLET
jgi:hypothetical protein